ncbi:avidin-like [Hemitrygon akajei]|uniref:avidin-like n=1 Tax=Hemitrygon akajei TaxID=2704970 RepID=UPI003BF9FB01
MLRKLPRLTLLLALGIVGASCSTGVQTLTGCWTNELGSTANIMMDEDGTLQGIYRSAVSRTGTQAEGELIGFQVDIAHPTFGFVVKWTTESVRGNVTAWTGQMFVAEGTQTLKTMWLLRSGSSVDGNWAATLTGTDIFTRCIVKCGSAGGDGSERECDPGE